MGVAGAALGVLGVGAALWVGLVAQVAGGGTGAALGRVFLRRVRGAFHHSWFCMSFNLGLGLLSAHLHSYQQDRVCAIRSAGAAGGRECFLFDPDSNPDQTDMA